MAELFGFRIERPKKDEGSEPSFTSPTPDDGTIEVAGGGFFGQILDTDGRQKSDLDLIRRYRDIAQQAECDTAVEDIVNEGIVSNESDQAVQITLDRLPFQEKIKRKIRAEFSEVLRLLHFEQKGHDIFRRWYVDGRMYYHKIIDKKNPRKPIETSISKDQYSNKSIVLVDDVLNSGSTLIYGVKHFLETGLLQFKTAVLVNRNHKKFPVKADFKGISLSTSMQSQVMVEFKGSKIIALLV